MSSSGSSSPNLSSKVSCIHTFSSSATNLHTSTVLRGYVLGNLGLWILPLVVTVIIFSWWGSCTPTGRIEKRGINAHSFSFSQSVSIVCTDKDAFVLFAFLHLARIFAWKVHTITIKQRVFLTPVYCQIYISYSKLQEFSEVGGY